MEPSWESFGKLRELLILANHSTENVGISGSKIKWKGNFRLKNFSVK